jgi:hypothetical protein
MMTASDRDSIRRFMEAKKAGRSTDDKELRYDPTSKKFVVASRGSRETLPLVENEDLKAF